MRALGASPWVCLSVRAIVHSQGNDIASGVLLVAKFQSPLSWEELCGASLYQLREEGLLVSQLSKASLNFSTQVWLWCLNCEGEVRAPKPKIKCS